MIEHTVTFRLAHEPGSVEEVEFLFAAGHLDSIPGVQDFCIRRQVSEKNPHAFYISMKFATQEDYDQYGQHPLHLRFLEERWFKEVVDFQEADFVDL